MNKYIARSLRLQLFFAALISLFVAIIVFGTVFFAGNVILDQTVYGQTFAKHIANQQFTKLQNYVETEGISLERLQRLNAWCSRGEKIYLVIYDANRQIYSFPESAAKALDDPELEEEESEYMLILQGGYKVRAFLYYYAGDAYYFWMTVFSGLIAFLSFSLCFIVLINRKISYISLLRRELDILSGGQLEYLVTINGCDELGELALGIDQMRSSIKKHQETESQMRAANSELITAMSHDLRTPLTSLLAYLEIIERKKYKDKEQMDNLIHKSVTQTLRIKDMADKLFEYFLVYATEREGSKLETVDADQFFCQILEEYAYSLESQGLPVQKELSQVSGQIQVDTDLLHRVLDNLYSNLLKYADPQQRICFTYKRQVNAVLFSVSNGILSNIDRKRSTGIGLNTCRRIVEYHGGEFVLSETEDVFCIKIVIPLLN